MHISTFFGTVATFLLVSSCCNIKPADYRLQAAIQDQATAFRRGAQRPEVLNLLVKLQNMSADALRLASGDPESREGLLVEAELLDSKLPFSLSSNKLEPGLKGGLCLKGFSNGNQSSILDGTDSAVKKLASSSSQLFKHDADSYTTALHLNANEAFLFLNLSVKWDRVPSDISAIRYDIPIRLTFSYVDRKGKILKHPGVLEHVATVNLSNARRYPAFLPVVGGPVSGKFE